MIHVQIASQITAEGVSGVRWVLVETVDAVRAEQAAPAVAHAAPDIAAATASAGAAPTPEGLRLLALKAGVVALGLGAALWTAVVQVGPPGQAAMPKAPVSPAGAVASPAAEPRQPQRQAVPLRIAPAARPAAPAAPAAPAPVSAPAATTAASAAADGLPRLTAGL